MKSLNILEQVSQISGKNDKLSLLKENSNDEQLAKLLDATFNRSRIFHIKKFNENQVKSDEIGDNFDYFVNTVLPKLEDRDWKGNEAIACVENFFKLCNPLEQKWYARVLRKDLRAGFSDKTAVKAGFKDIKPFDVMLAKDAKKCKKLLDIVAKGVWLSPKLDGYRCLAIINDGSVTLMSRNGTEYLNFPTIVDSLKKGLPKGKYVLDGEIMSDDFQSMQKSAFANKRKTSVGDVYYAVFGYIPYDEWMSQDFKMLTGERIKTAEALVETCETVTNNIIMVQQIYTNELATIHNMQFQWEKLGYEGAMALPDGIPYYLGKKANKLLKFKTMETQDCVITGMYEGDEHSDFKGTMGGVILRQENGKECRCGSGWSIEDRKIMWKDPELFIGNIIEVKYQELTPDEIMRFPVFIRWRNDK